MAKCNIWLYYKEIKYILYNMRDWIVEKRTKEILSNGKVQAQDVKQLFVEYEQDKLNGLPPEESEARAILMLINIPLVSYVLMHKFGFDSISDDLEEMQVGKMGLIKAIDLYDISKNVNFSTYATKVIQNEILMHLRKQNSYTNTPERTKVSMEECVIPENDGELHIVDMIKDDCNICEEVAEKDLLERTIIKFKHLSPLEQQTLVSYFGLCGKQRMTQEEVGAEFGKSRSSISQIVSRALSKLRLLIVSEEELNDMALKRRKMLLAEIYPLQDCVKDYLEELRELNVYNLY